MTKVLRRAGITGTGSFLPEGRITNKDLVDIVDTSEEWIESRTGILERRKASFEEAASDLGANAARKALENAGIEPGEVDLIIVATITPDMPFPATACFIQDKIGAVNAAAFDLSAGCTGFVYALAIASQFIESGMYETILVVASEVLTKFINWKDRNTCVIFGDGAGAAVVRPVNEDEGFLAFDLGAVGKGAELLNMPAGGSRQPASPQTVQESLHTIKMNGNEVFKFAVNILSQTANESLKKGGLTVEDIDFMVPHQANYRIIDAALKRLKLAKDKVYLNLDRYGNMSGASVPVALDEAVKEGRIKKGDYIILVAFGAGLTWGSCALKWTG